MKFTIVTPTFNGERYIAETMQSVISQSGDFSIEYIVVDACSSDRTPEIVAEFQERLARDGLRIACRGVDLVYLREPDEGMYDAIDKGFRHGSGDVLAWINADDIYLPGALAVVARCFERFAEVDWLKGRSTYMNGASTICRPCRNFVYSRRWLAEGYYGPVAPFVEQESVFWRAGLWPRVGAEVARLRMAGDYIAWKRMAAASRLYCLDAMVSCFRRVEGQKSQDIEAYWREVAGELPSSRWRSLAIRVMKRLAGRLPVRLTGRLLGALLGYEDYAVIVPDAKGDGLRVVHDALPEGGHAFEFL